MLFAAVLVVLAGAVYAYFGRAFRYWSDRNVAHLSPSIPFGNIGNPLTRKRAFYESVGEVYRRFKAHHAAAGFYVLTQPHLVPCSLELIQRVLVRDFGSFVDRGLFYNEAGDPLTANLFFMGGQRWRTLRQKLTATFTSAKMGAMFGIVMECAGNLVPHLAHYQGDVREILARYSTEVIGACAFGLDCGSLQDADADFRRYTRKVFEYSPWKTFKRMLQMLAPGLCRSIGMAFIPRDLTAFFTSAVRDAVRMRKVSRLPHRNDFLQLLIELEAQGLLAEKDFAAQSFVFFIAGFETSATTMAYLLYELSKDADIQTKCRKELLATMPDGRLTYDVLMGLPYLDAVVKETLRMYPVLPFLHRECTSEYKLNENLTLPMGSKLVVPVLALHMDPDLYPDPHRFDPERFVENAQRESCLYMPFGEGPRKCIGNRFGLMQVKVGVAAILRHYKIVKDASTTTRLQWDTNSFTLKTRNDLRLIFEPI